VNDDLQSTVVERAITPTYITINRTARYFTLGPTDGSAREILFVLHGYGQLADEFLEAFRPLDDGTRLIVAPEGLSRFYPKGMNGEVGASWMTRVDRQIEIDEYVAYLDMVRTQMESTLKSGFGIPVSILGFSQGGATAARWASMGAKPATRVVIWSSSVPPDIDPDNKRIRRMALTLVQGRRDPLISPEQIRSERERLAQAGITYEWVEFDGGHAIDSEVLKRLF
jgi:predicted esterase